MQKATVGRIVNIVMCNAEVRPMIVTQAFDVTEHEGVENQLLNGTVFLDGGNDLNPSPPTAPNNVPVGLDVLVGTSSARGWSRPYSETKEPGSWHWPERV